MTRVFLICPVRNVTPGESTEIAAYVARLELGGIRVHWPARDTIQSGDGFVICCANLAAMRAADEVHVWWTGSEGSVFDLGMAFALGKWVMIAKDVTAVPGKSFANVLRAIARGSA
jgi:hypothetical protein